MLGANEIDKIAERYRALCERVPLKPITSKTGYEGAVGHLNRLLEAGGARYCATWWTSAVSGSPNYLKLPRR